MGLNQIVHFLNELFYWRAIISTAFTSSQAKLMWKNVTSNQGPHRKCKGVKVKVDAKKNAQVKVKSQKM